MIRQGTIGSALALVGMAISAGGTLRASQSAPIALKPGVAAGTLQAGAQKVALAHAYALASSDAMGPIYQVLLTDGPIPPEMLAKELQRGGQTLLKSGKLSGISMLVGVDGFIRNIVPYLGDLRGSRMLSSAGKLTSFVVSAKAASGQGSMSIDSTMGQGWAYSASWNATLLATN
jgi:hypothetical protein